MRYAVMMRRTWTGYSADVPDVPGSIATGMTVEHVRQMMADALEMHIEAMQLARESIPPPSSSMQFEVDDSAAEEFCTWVEVGIRESAIQ